MTRRILRLVDTLTSQELKRFDVTGRPEYVVNLIRRVLEKDIAYSNAVFDELIPDVTGDGVD